MPIQSMGIERTLYGWVKARGDELGSVIVPF
jgi:hypothetical protein